MKKTTSKLFAGAAGGVAVLGILIAANALFSGVRVRKDLTAERLYTLAPGTVQMLQELDRPVTLKFYFTQGNPNVPTALKNYVQRTLDFLRDLEARSGGNVALETFDPQPDSDAEEWAQRYGLTAQATGGLGMPPDLYLGLVAVAGTKEAAIPFLDPSAEPQLEYLVARLVQEVTQSRRPRIGILSTLPVLAEPASPFLPARQQDWLFVSELKKSYEVVPVAPEAEAIPDDVDTLVAVHPRNLSARTLFALDQFVLRGGRLLAFVDPMNLASEQEMEDGLARPQLASDLNRLTEAWGVKLENAQVVADVAAATPINVGDGRAERLPAWLSLRGGVNLDRDEIATGSLESLMLPFAGALVGTPVEGLELKTLARASGEAVALNAFAARDPSGGNLRGGKPAASAALAVRLTGKFKTAFPDGQPKVEGVTNETVAATNEWLKASEKDGAAVLVADADLLVNDYMARGINFFGRTLYQPFNDNLNFVLNLVEQLSGNPALIGLRGRGTFHRPFERVLAMEKAAQERWQLEEEKLQQKLAETQRRLNELQATKSEDQQLVLSAAQKAELEKFRQERFETQRQLKQVRKNLRSSIENLGLALKVLNLAAVPLLVAAFGIGLGWRRRRQSAA
ncbi:MAG: Gldg family protein [Kiritimatiellia bacterium]